MNDVATQRVANRAPLYRRVGGRHPLICDVACSMTEVAFRDGGDGAPTQPRQSRTAAIINRWVGRTMEDHGMQRFLENEGIHTMKVLTVPSTDFQLRPIEFVRSLLDAVIDDGQLRADIPTDDLAYVVVRVVESYVYIALITGESAVAPRANRVIDALLPPAGSEPVAPVGPQ